MQLMAASHYGHGERDVVEKLLEKGATIHVQAKDGRTADGVDDRIQTRCKRCCVARESMEGMDSTARMETCDQ